MGALSILLLILLYLPSPPAAAFSRQFLKSPRLLDLLIRDYTFKLFNNSFKTGVLQSVQLPANLSGIEVDTIRLRCGSLRRYGAGIKEFRLSSGVNVHPCIERLVLIRQNLGRNWSDLYRENFDLNGYRLISPVLGLLAYNGGDDVNHSSNPFELGVIAGENPIRIDFSNLTLLKSGTQTPYCASFVSSAVSSAESAAESAGGRVVLASMTEPFVCVASKQGHFALVVESATEGVVPAVEEEYRKTEASRWKVAVGSSIGAALGAFLIGLLLIAIFVRVKKKTKMEEMVRRAYEEEALQVSMVGHVRAPTAPVTRTLPTAVEHHYRPLPF